MAKKDAAVLTVFLLLFLSFVWLGSSWMGTSSGFTSQLWLASAGLPLASCLLYLIASEKRNGVLLRISFALHLFFLTFFCADYVCGNIWILQNMQYELQIRWIAVLIFLLSALFLLVVMIGDLRKHLS